MLYALIYLHFFFSQVMETEIVLTTANITIKPPIKVQLVGGFSFINIHAQKGPKTASDNIMIPTKAEGVDLAPIVIKIKPKPSWKKSS